MAGGQDGKVGANYWLKQTAKGSGAHTRIDLGPSNQTSMRAGDHIVIRKIDQRLIILTATDTPGGGGYGPVDSAQDPSEDKVQRRKRTLATPVRASGSLATFRATQTSSS
jgi:N-methylhydantoinase B/oxoprolinase/acetone carboxylase alpha subunit